MNRVRNNVGDGAKLSRLMDEQGRRGDWVATKLGVSQATVSLWRNGKQPIPWYWVRPLAEVLGVDEDALLADVGVS